MTHNEELVYFGRSSLKVAGELIAYSDRPAAIAIARSQLRLCTSAAELDAALISFWAGVLFCSEKMTYAPDQLQAFALALSSRKLAAFESLKRRAVTQMTP